MLQPRIHETAEAVRQKALSQQRYVSHTVVAENLLVHTKRENTAGLTQAKAAHAIVSEFLLMQSLRHIQTRWNWNEELNLRSFCFAQAVTVCCKPRREHTHANASSSMAWTLYAKMYNQRPSHCRCKYRLITWSSPSNKSSTTIHNKSCISLRRTSDDGQ